MYGTMKKIFNFIFGKEIIFTIATWVWFILACICGVFIDKTMLHLDVLALFVIYILGFIMLEYISVRINKKKTEV